MADQRNYGIVVHGGTVDIGNAAVGPGASIQVGGPAGIDEPARGGAAGPAGEGPASPSPGAEGARDRPVADEPDEPDEPAIDVFISYVDPDQAWAEWIGWQLEEAGHRIRLRAWDFLAGSAYVDQVHRATRDTARTVAVLSSAYLRCAQAQAQWQAAWFTDPVGRRRRLLAARVEDCDRPGLLAQLVSIDLFGVDAATAGERLRRAVGTRREKPTRPPAFPAGRTSPAPAFPPTGPPRTRG